MDRNYVDSMSGYSFHRASLAQLSSAALLEILQLRAQVFVVEQNCVYADPDEYDAHALHLWIRNPSGIVAYARILAPSTRFEECSIGRVLSAEAVRGKGFGRLIMERSIEEALRSFQTNRIRISAQCYVQEFYEDLGFVAQGEVYDEDGIPHREMVYSVVDSSSSSS